MGRIVEVSFGYQMAFVLRNSLQLQKTCTKLGLSLFCHALGRGAIFFSAAATGCTMCPYFSKNTPLMQTTTIKLNGLEKFKVKRCLLGRSVSLGDKRKY